MNFTMVEQPLDPGAYDQWPKSKKTYIQCSLSGVVLGEVLRLHESYQKDSTALASAFKKQFSSLDTFVLRTN